ncbi:protein NDR1-like [Cynara cardunculus var. scolymus]|uniref:protein NDR1-like n=1 Tax=Cynara cardunculus var. scolymus TaxID=59895 RepID=UPI000D6267CA|nr:protein NDR1-like [Cynara cardunculus var. scolymus]
MSDYGDSDRGTGCYRCCFSFLLTLGLTSLFLWLSLRTSNPVCSIQDVYIPALNKTRNSTSYQSIYLDLKLDNENKDKGIYYDPVDITLHYYVNGSNSDFIRIANYTIRGFYQGHQKKTRRKNWTDTYGVPWDAAVRTMNGGGKVVFRVNLETAVRFKILFWKTKRHGLIVGADFDVNDVGMKVSKKGTRLKSGAPGFLSGETPVWSLLVVFSTLVLV